MSQQEEMIEIEEDKKYREFKSQNPNLLENIKKILAEKSSEGSASTYNITEKDIGNLDGKFVRRFLCSDKELYTKLAPATIEPYYLTFTL
jgi:hypothetical protein